MNQKLNIFISSTSDLRRWRNATTKALSELNIDDLKFESWPSSSNDPINECLLNLEFRHANKHGRPIFVYLLKKHKFAPEQIEFIKEIEKNKFHCQPIISIRNLQDAIKDSFLKEFARCFRKVHSLPDRVSPKTDAKIEQNNILKTEDDDSTYNFLISLFTNGEDLQIHNYWADCFHRFNHSPKIMNIVYMAEVNLGITGYSIEESHLTSALNFWLNNTPNKREENFSRNYNIGNAYLALRDYKNSIKYYNMSLKENENFAECWHNLGSAYKGANNLKSTLDCYKKSLKINPQLFNSLLSIAIYYYRDENDPQQAQKYLNRISIAQLSLKHKSHILGWQANVNLDLCNYEIAIANVENALHFVQDEDWLWYLAGRLYGLIRVLDHSWLEISERFWKKFIRKFPNNSQAWAELGFIYWFLKDKASNSELNESSLSSFEKAIEYGYDNELVYDRIGHLYQDKKDYNNAEKAFRKATLKNQKDFGYCLGVCLIYLDRYEEALQYVLDAAEKYQPDYLSWFQVGYCYEKLGEIDQAEYALKKAIKLNSDYPVAYFNLGGLYWNNNKIDKAKKIWKIALTKFPTHELSAKAKALLDSVDEDTNKI